jgi:signal peptidase II
MNGTQTKMIRGRFPPLPWMWLGISVIVILLDWQTKQMASESLVLYQSHAIFSWLNMTLAHNYGAAFSFLSNAGGWQRWFFILLSSAVSLVLLIWLLRLPRHEWRTGLALGLVIGGAIGNLIDRVQLGYVVDFVDVVIRGWHYPAFNVADSAITAGVVLLLLDGVLQAFQQETSEK